MGPGWGVVSASLAGWVILSFRKGVSGLSREHCLCHLDLKPKMEILNQVEGVASMGERCFLDTTKASGSDNLENISKDSDISQVRRFV